MSEYKVVPVEPTAEMMATGGIEMGARDEDARTVWKAMIAAAPAVQGEPVGWVNSDELDNMLDDRTATLFPVRTGFHGKPLYTAPQPAEQQPAPDVAGLVEALTELCDEIDKHDIHAAISSTSILWFKRKARAALAAHRKRGGES